MLNLQTIILRTPLLISDIWLIPYDEQRTRADRVKEYWIDLAKHVLTQIQLRDNLEKTVVVLDYDGSNETRILIKPNSSPGFEGSVA